jgi:hypothetical protein
MLKSKIVTKRDIRRERLMMLGGVLGGMLAGVGISFLIPMRRAKMMGMEGQSFSTSGSSHSSRPSSRTSSSSRRETKGDGTNLASGRIETGEQQGSNKPATNDSMGG